MTNENQPQNPNSNDTGILENLPTPPIPGEPSTPELANAQTAIALANPQTPAICSLQTSSSIMSEISNEDFDLSEDSQASIIAHIRNAQRSGAILDGFRKLAQCENCTAFAKLLQNSTGFIVQIVICNETATTGVIEIEQVNLLKAAMYHARVIQDPEISREAKRTALKVMDVFLARMDHGLYIIPPTLWWLSMKTEPPCSVNTTMQTQTWLMMASACTSPCWKNSIKTVE